MVSAVQNLPLPSAYIQLLKETQQNPRFHAEGSVYTHTCMVVSEVLAYAKNHSLSQEEKTILYWTAVLHDIGKPTVTKWEHGRWRSPGHEMAGVNIAREILSPQTDISPLQKRIILDLIRWHHIPLRWGLKKKSIDTYKALATRIDLRLLGIFSLCDIKGRKCVDQERTIQMIEYFIHFIAPAVQNELELLA
ncbi:MAG: HD domain-containing protein [Bacteroidota bacterium]